MGFAPSGRSLSSSPRQALTHRVWDVSWGLQFRVKGVLGSGYRVGGQGHLGLVSGGRIHMGGRERIRYAIKTQQFEASTHATKPSGQNL